jgi:hypothetical protein
MRRRAARTPSRRLGLAGHRREFVLDSARPEGAATMRETRCASRTEAITVPLETGRPPEGHSCGGWIGETLEHGSTEG